jgi:hypothetical protein
MSVLVSLHGGVNMRKWISWRLCCVDMRTTRLVTLSNLERPNTRTSTPSHEFGPTNHNLNAHYTPISLTTSTPWCQFHHLSKFRIVNDCPASTNNHRYMKKNVSAQHFEKGSDGIELLTFLTSQPFAGGLDLASQVLPVPAAVPVLLLWRGG